MPIDDPVAPLGTSSDPAAGVDPEPDPVVVTESRDTAIIEPVVRSTLPELETEVPFLPEHPEKLQESEEPEIEQDLPPEVLEAEAAADEPMPDVEPESAAKQSRRKATTPKLTPTPTDSTAIAATAPDAVPPARPDPFPWGDRGSAIFSDSDELEQTLIVPRRDTGERFVLQFSTGESVTVFGSGLLGRNPTPQPTEYFDQLVSITDPGKSVSKTHLEFGQEAGAFWVSDRFSGNGSAVREPESSARRLVAGKRYRVVRGTRVDIGEQFFVIS
jgi:hypothetical protein